MGIPLRADPTLLRNAERRSFVRACAAFVLGARDNRSPDAVLRHWHDDPMAGRIVKAAQRQTSTEDFPQLQTTAVLPMLSPASASARLLGLATSLDLSGVATVKVPFIGASGLPAVPFVEEGKPAPVVDLSITSATLGPAKKLLIMAALTREVQDASADTAEAVISTALATAAEQSMDAAMFSAASGDDVRPPGLLNGTSAVPSAGKTGAEGVADDLGLLAKAIGSAGISADDMVVVTTPELATKIRVLSSPKFANAVLSSASLPDGTVIGVVPRGLVTGYSGATSIEVAPAPAVHFEDTNPKDIFDPAPAHPTKSAFQTDLIVLRLRAWCAWAVHSGAVAQVTGADW
jgi:hypothetical protein